MVFDDRDALLRLFILGAVFLNAAPGLEGAEPIAFPVEPLPEGERRRAARCRGGEEEQEGALHRAARGSRVGAGVPGTSNSTE